MIRKKSLIMMFTIIFTLLCLAGVQADAEVKAETKETPSEEPSGVKEKRYLSHGHASHPQGTPCPPFYPKITPQPQIKLPPTYGPPSYPKSQVYVPKYHTMYQQYIHRPIHQSGWQKPMGWQQPMMPWQQMQHQPWQMQQQPWQMQQQQQQQPWKMQQQPWQMQQQPWQISQPKVVVQKPIFNYAPMYQHQPVHTSPQYIKQPEVHQKPVIILKQECPNPCAQQQHTSMPYHPPPPQIKWIKPEPSISYIKVPYSQPMPHYPVHLPKPMPPPPVHKFSHALGLKDICTK